jgi:peptide/nickel transport system substrate-binding protein
MLDELGQNARRARMCPAIPRLLLAAVMALAVASCGGQSEAPLDVVVIGQGRPALADPAAGALSRPDQVLLSNVAQGLVRFDARGQIDPGLAERWNVSDDGLSYIFRIAAADWPDGRQVNARDVARILNRQLRAASRNPLKDTLGAVSEIVAMTDRVIEVRLLAPRPNLLQLLAQPEFAIVRQGQGSGPFQPDAKQAVPGVIALTHTIRIVDDKDRVEHVRLHSAAAAPAIERFRKGSSALVLGGTFAELPLVPRRDRNIRNALRFDPVAGLFGLAPARSGGPLADKELRDLLNRAIDREALIAALNVPNLVPRTTLMQTGLEGGANPIAPAWAAMPLAERRARAMGEARTAIGSGEAMKLAIALPQGPGADILFARLAADWRPLGIELVRGGKGVPADLRLIDQVAPSSSPAWFVRNFRCGVASLCSKAADGLMDSARLTLIGAPRAAMLAEAGRLIDEDVLYLPIAAPIRWSLVSDLPGFAENIFARHPLSGLRDKPNRERQ